MAFTNPHTDVSLHKRWKKHSLSSRSPGVFFIQVRLTDCLRVVVGGVVVEELGGNQVEQLLKD